MSKQLSSTEKNSYFPILIERDGGFICFYCGLFLQFGSFVFEHLNNNRNDNRMENIVLACQSCNNAKPYDQIMQVKALEKLKQNEGSNYVREKISIVDSNKEVSAEIEINVTNSEITEQYITESVKANGSIEYTDALHSSVFLCKSKTGHGSQQSVRNYIASLTSVVGPFQIIRDDDKKKVIVKRGGNQ